jgi:hypothetical protein
MDWFTFITRETEAIAWPAVAIFAIFILRKPLAQLPKRVREFSWSRKRGLRILLAKEIEEVSEEATAAGLPVAGISMYQLAPPDSFINIVQTFPEMGVMQSWADLERTVRDVAMRHNLDGASTRRLSDVLSALRERQVIDDPTFRLIDRLRVIRNGVVHGRTEQPPTSGEALEFYNLSRAVLERFRDSAKRTP